MVTPYRPSGPEWIFALRRVALNATIEKAEIWAVDTASKATSLIVTYRLGLNALAGSCSLPAYSHRGDRIVVSTMSTVLGRCRVVMVDLASGTVVPLVRDDTAWQMTPLWTADDSQIVFLHSEIQVGGVGNEPQEVWVVRPDGSALRRVGTGAGPLITVSPEGTVYYAQLLGALGGVDLNSGNLVHGTAGIAADPRGTWDRPSANVDWRAAVPRFVGAFSSVDVGSSPLDHASVANSRGLLQPRWQPGANRIMALSMGTDNASTALHLLETAAGTDKALPASSPDRAEWSASGADIYYLAREFPGFGQTTIIGTTLRRLHMADLSDELLWRPPAPSPPGSGRFSDIAVFPRG